MFVTVEPNELWANRSTINSVENWLLALAIRPCFTCGSFAGLTAIVSRFSRLQQERLPKPVHSHDIPMTFEMTFPWCHDISRWRRAKVGPQGRRSCHVTAIAWGNSERWCRLMSVEWGHIMVIEWSLNGHWDSDQTKCWNPIRLCGWDSSSWPGVHICSHLQCLQWSWCADPLAFQSLNRNRTCRDAEICRAWSSWSNNQTCTWIIWIRTRTRMMIMGTNEYDQK